MRQIDEPLRRRAIARMPSPDWPASSLRAAPAGQAGAARAAARADRRPGLRPRCGARHGRAKQRGRRRAQPTGRSRSICTKPVSPGATARPLSTAARPTISSVPRCRWTGSPSRSGAVGIARGAQEEIEASRRQMPLRRHEPIAAAGLTALGERPNDIDGAALAGRGALDRPVVRMQPAHPHGVAAGADASAGRRCRQRPPRPCRSPRARSPAG